MSPSLIDMPSPAMSVLKKFLAHKGFETKIIYWNLKMKHLENEFLWNYVAPEGGSEQFSLLIYDNYLAFKYNDKEAKARIKSSLISIKPSFSAIDSNYFDRHMEYFFHKFDEFIDTELRRINWGDILYVGFSANLYQWIPSSIFAQKIKAISPRTIILLGGIGTREAAIDYLNNFSQFDFASWGEGENVMNEFSKVISGNSEISKLYEIPHIAFRYSQGIYSSKRNSEFVDLNDANLAPDFNDYFEQKTENRITLPSQLFIEGSRGCHWGKCHFCYLNNGYRHRVKNVDTIICIIKRYIEEYKINNFVFLDNDIVTNDWNRFDDLLDKLIDIKNTYSEFNIILAEIITRGFSEKFIRKMSRAGFNCVQIGYESPSDFLLKKIDKKNTFASNLLFMKFAYKYRIKINGMNVICGLPEETDSDVMESISNLKFMRFFLQTFHHNMSRLAIMKSSKYFNQLKEDSSFVMTSVYNFLPKDLLLAESVKSCNIVEKIKSYVRPSWQEFSTVESYYRDNLFSYKIINNTDYITYQEYLNNEKINELDIEKNSLEYVLLVEANSKVYSLDEFKEALASRNISSSLLDCEIFEVIESLKSEGILYATPDYSEILAIVDINMAI